MEKSIKEISLEITKLNEELKGLESFWKMLLYLLLMSMSKDRKLLELMNIVLQFHFLIG